MNKITKSIIGDILIIVAIIIVGIAYVTINIYTDKKAREKYEEYVKNTPLHIRQIHHDIPETKNDTILLQEIIHLLNEHQCNTYVSSLVNDSTVITIKYYPIIKMKKIVK